MKKLLHLLILTSAAAQAQRLPATFGVNKVRITAPGKTILVELSTKKESELYNDRLYYWYGSNAIHTTQGDYSGKLLDGSFQEYYSDKSLHEQGEFKKGLKEGTWKTWQENGALDEIATWHNGLKDGEFTLYDAAGKPRQAGRYKDGLLDGKVLVYHEKDSVETIKYKGGQIVSNKLETPSLWQKVKAIKWKHKETLPTGTVPTMQLSKPKKVKKHKGKDTVLNVY
jgi:hypothetical protein